MRWTWMIVALCAGCSDYSLGGGPKPVDVDPGEDSGATDPDDPPETGAPDTAPPDDTDPPTDTALPDTDEPDDTDLPASCDGFDGAWTWWGSPPFPGEPDPVDAAGEPFHSPSFTMTGWSSVAIPDQAIPVAHDRAYRTSFTLTEVPPSLRLDLQSDDGIGVWLNGALVGRWGGGWQEEGCVNENAECVATVAVPEVDVTPWLVVGVNVLAARVSNPVQSAWFEIVPRCVE